MGSVRLSPAQLLAFTRYLATLFAAGIPLTRCLEILHQQAEDPVYAEMVWTLLRMLESGKSLSRACEAFPNTFSRTYLAVLRVAEQTGRLNHSLLQLGQWMERDELQKGQLRAALAYPAVVLVVTMLLSLGMCWYVLPGVLQGLSPTHLPLPTRLLMLAVLLLQKPLGAVLVVALLASGVGGGYRLWRSPSAGLRLALWRFGLARAGLGPALRDSSLVRYCAAAQLLSGSSAPVLMTLELAGQASGNPCLAQDSRRLRKMVEEGDSVAAAMEVNRALYGPLLPSMARVADETGRFDLAFGRTQQFLEEEVHYRFRMLQQALEPLLLLVVALVVCFFLLSVLLPLYSQFREM